LYVVQIADAPAIQFRLHDLQALPVKPLHEGDHFEISCLHGILTLKKLPVEFISAWTRI
jgi:hypothetical protein